MQTATTSGNPPTPAHVAQWKAAKEHLKANTTAATYTANFERLALVEMSAHHWTLRADNPRAAVWLETRLLDTLHNAIENATGNPPQSITITAPTAEPLPTIPTTPPLENDSHTPQRLPGFNYPTQNWTQVPDFFFTEVMPNATPTAFKLVAAIIHNTIGQRNKQGAWSEWWAAVSYKTLGTATGTENRTALADAINSARARGWIKRRPRANSFDYSLRFDDQPLDHPDDPAPTAKSAPPKQSDNRTVRKSDSPIIGLKQSDNRTKTIR